MTDGLRRRAAVYLYEAGGLAFFVAVASAVTALLEYPGSPVHAAMESRTLRRAVLAVVMGFVVVAVTAVAGPRSGAHINPAITWAFWRHGKIGAWDAAAYTAAQCTGAVAAALAMRAALGAAFAHPAVDFAVTKPGPGGPGVAFAAEFAISFVFMLTMLAATESRRLEHAVGWIAGALLVIYIIVETPLSGMSLNPARSLGSAVAAPVSPALWLYAVAPTLAMLAAVEAYRWFGVAARIPGHCPGPTYPRPPGPEPLPRPVRPRHR